MVDTTALLASHGLVVERPLGSGASGHVVAAIDTETGGRKVAVKIFDGLTGYARLSLAREVESVCKLDHRGIVTIHRAHTQADPPFVVFELAEFRPRQLPLSAKDAIDAGVKLCSALAAAHDVEIVHSDVKPDNVLWRRGLEPVLSDFGSARIIAMTQHRSGIGFQPEWSPPWMTSPSAANKDSDIWSLAATIVWFRTLKEPSEVDWKEVEPPGLGAVLKAAMDEAAPGQTSRAGQALELARRLQALQRELGHEVTPLSSDQQDRPHPPHNKLVHEDLQSLAKTEVADRCAASLGDLSEAPTQVIGYRGRRRTGLVLASAAIVAAAGFTTLLAWPRLTLSEPLVIDDSQGEPEESTDPIAPEHDSADTSRSATLPMPTTAPVTTTSSGRDAADSPTTVSTGSSPTTNSGQGLVFASDRSGDLDIYLMSATGEVTSLVDRPFDDYNPSLSPDGRQLVFESDANGTRAVYSMPLDRSAEPRQLSPVGVEAIEPAWSPTGDQIAWVSREQANWDIALYSRTEGTTRLVTTSSSDEHSPAWSPDGSRLALRSDRTGAGDIYVLDLASGAIQQVTSSPSPEDRPAWGPGAVIAFEVRLDGDIEVFTTTIGDSSKRERQTDRLGFDGFPAFINGQLLVVQVDGATSSLVREPSGEAEIVETSAGVIQGLKSG